MSPHNRRISTFRGRTKALTTVEISGHSLASESGSKEVNQGPERRDINLKRGELRNFLLNNTQAQDQGSGSPDRSKLDRVVWG